MSCLLEMAAAMNEACHPEGKAIMDTTGFNILERIVARELEGTKLTTLAPRSYVRRLSITAMEMESPFTGAEDRPGFPISKLLAAEGQIDWSSSFKVMPIEEEEGVEAGDVMELELRHYSDLPVSDRGEVLFSFSGPVSDGMGGNVIYGVADRGFLWAHGFLCRFEGTFEEPGEMEFLKVWRS